ncbi:CP family cyanate transporter-like MFS transporter [Catenuloplanes nepalensis]|uniref:CP family cyanate transporter-like MFS transporter n=2 Tax=Catenuloplanes nepalensis TaxID=587533 RepID=A0ABT9N5G3_9ACTN|nr:CP family cyanate transporter-like MFS transporter [Catenuloplanes nepalensis]
MSTSPMVLEPAAAVAPAVRGRARGTLLVLAAMLLVALNLRTSITSVGSLLTEVREGLQLSGLMAGVVTTMPTIAFAFFGAFTPVLVRRFSAPRVLVAAMVALVAGQALRVATGSAAVFVITSALALSGIAIGNVLMPMLVKQHFPERTGLVTGAYSVSMSIGATIGAAATVPIAHAFGSWRAGLGVWAILALAAIPLWLPAALRHRAASRATAVPGAETIARVRPGATRLGWAMAIFFGAQSLSGYAAMGWLPTLFRDAGFSPENAGLLLGILSVVGVPMGLIMPSLTARLPNLHGLILALAGLMIVAYLGMMLAPRAGAYLWVVVLSVGQSAFPLALTVLGLRARTAEGTVALSAFAQSIGYLFAALGPLLVGYFYGLTGAWTVPMLFLVAVALLQATAGLAIARPRFIEDE